MEIKKGNKVLIVSMSGSKISGEIISVGRKYFYVDCGDGYPDFKFEIETLEDTSGYSNRIFQSEKTYKRKMNTNSIIEINELYGSDKKYHEVISDQNGVGVIKTSNKMQSFEKTLVYRDLFDFLNKLFKQEEVNAPKQLQNQLITFIKEKRKDHELDLVAGKFKLDFQYVLKIKNILEENIEKQIYHDILILMKKELKADDIIMNKYSCSKGYIIKIKQKFSNIAEKKLKAMGISIKDYLSE